MPRLDIPEFGDGLCDFMRVIVAEVLTHDEFDAVKQLVESDIDLRMSSTRIGGRDTTFPVEFRERLLVHAVSRDEAEGLRREFPEAAKDAAAHLHLEFIVDSADDDDEVSLKYVDRTEEVFAWICGRRGGVEASVIAGRSFPIQDYEPAVPFPRAVQPFTRVRALTFVRDSDDSQPGAPVYEVHLQEYSGVLAAGVSFRSKLAGSADTLQRLLVNASDIAAFAIRPRVQS